MLFSKLKAKSDELLPPPPPFPSMEIEEKPEAKPSKAKDDFEDLFKEVESLKLERIKEPKLPKIKAPKTEKKPIPKIKEKPVKLKPAKPLRETKFVKRLPAIKIKASAVKPIKSKPKLEELELPEEKELKIEDFEFPEIEEEFESDIEAKPKELQEAQDEIKSAIEKIKEWEPKQEKQSFFQKLFAKKTKEEILPEAGDDISSIKAYISRAREALTKFDLESAKKNYIELIKIYNKISSKQQAKVYREINDLYSERKSAEGLKV